MKYMLISKYLLIRELTRTALSRARRLYARAVVSRSTPHLCAHPGCAVVLVDGPGRCPAHARGRSRSGTPGYGSRWRRARDAYIRAHPRCERCFAPAQEVHHRNRRHPSEPGANAWGNLQALCRSCHRYVTLHPAG
jgi:5-methylcytosine-specific restriction protein A